MSFMPDSCKFRSDCFAFFPVFDLDFNQYSENKPVLFQDYIELDRIPKPSQEPTEDWIQLYSEFGSDSPLDDEIRMNIETSNFEKAAELKTLWLDIKQKAQESVGEPWTETATRMLSHLDGFVWHYYQLGRQQCLSSAGFWAEETLLMDPDDRELRQQVGGSEDREIWLKQMAAFNTMVTYLSTLSVTVRQNFQYVLERMIHIGPLRESNITVSPEKSRRTSWFAG